MLRTARRLCWARTRAGGARCCASLSTHGHELRHVRPGMPCVRVCVSRTSCYAPAPPHKAAQAYTHALSKRPVPFGGLNVGAFATTAPAKALVSAGAIDLGARARCEHGPIGCAHVQARTGRSGTQGKCALQPHKTGWERHPFSRARSLAQTWMCLCAHHCSNARAHSNSEPKPRGPAALRIGESVPDTWCVAVRRGRRHRRTAAARSSSPRLSCAC
jgi:hypothetical protein